MHENIVAKNQCDEASVLSGVAVVRDLPPLHRRYAVRRGMAALGLQGPPPPIDDLVVAAVPPSPPRMEPRRFLSGEPLYQWAVNHCFGDSRFDGIDGAFDFPRAMDAASMAVGPEAQARHQREHEDAVERYHHEKAIFDQWHGRATSYIMKALLGAFNVRPTRAIRDRRVDADARTEIGHLLGIRGGALTDQADDDFDRHRALASERGWRRFQTLGVHGIQRVWQTIFTMK